MTFPNYYSGINPNFLGGNPADFFTNPMRIDLGGMSTTTPTAGAPGNLSGVLQVINSEAFKGLPEGTQQQLLANPGLFGNNELDLLGFERERGLNELKRTEKFIEWEKERAKEANKMGRENLVLGSLLQMPGQIANTLVQASTAHLPYEREARQMMANTGANLQAGYSNLANMNTQFGNQVTNLFSNAASYRPTIGNLAGKYFA